MNSSLMQSQSQDEQEQRQNRKMQAMLPSHNPNESLADMVVKAATACNRVISERCGLCTLYCDKQVQYETAVMERYVTSGGAALTGFFHATMDQSPQVKEFQTMLFDEQSVVESVNSRCED